MEHEGMGFGFPTFASYMPGTVFEGYVRDNDWFIRNAPHDDIPGSADIERRTGTRQRSFAGNEETVRSIAAKCGEDFLRTMEGRGRMARERCRGVLLGTTAVESGVLGLQAADLSGMDPCNISALVQRTALRVAQALGVDGGEKVFGLNRACSSTVSLVDVGIWNASDFMAGDYYLTIMAEKLAAMIDVRDRNTGFLFGDCCAVTALQRGRTRFQILDVFSHTMPSPQLITFEERNALGPDGRGYPGRKCVLMPEGKKVLQVAGREMVALVGTSLERLGMKPSQVTRIVPHQANVRFVRPMQSEWQNRQWGDPPPVDIDTSMSGNNGASSWMRRMAELEEAKAFVPGDIVMCPFVGAGPNLDPTQMSVGNIALVVHDE